jgi:hypothetical protein
MDDVALDELGPIDDLVVEFSPPEPTSPRCGEDGSWTTPTGFVSWR